MKTGITVLQAKRLGIHLCPPEMTLICAAKRMAEEMISTLAVTDADGYLIGVLTRTDIIRTCRGSDNWCDVQVGDVMTRNVITVSPQDSLDDVIDLLLEKHIHRVIVVQEENGRPRPLTVVSAADIVYHLVRAAGEDLTEEE